MTGNDLRLHRCQTHLPCLRSRASSLRESGATFVSSAVRFKVNPLAEVGATPNPHLSSGHPSFGPIGVERPSALI